MGLDDSINVGGIPDPLTVGELEIGKQTGGDIYAGTRRYPTVQEAIDVADRQMVYALAQDSDPDFEETVTLDVVHGGLYRPGSQGSVKLFGSGDHVVNIPDGANDVTLQGFWIEQTDASGSHDAVRVQGREARLEDLGIDHAPRYAINLDGAPECHLLASEVSGGDTAAIRVSPSSANGLLLDNVAIKDPPGKGLVVEGGGRPRIDVTIDQPSSIALEVAANQANVDASVWGSGGTNSVEVTGSQGVYKLMVDDADTNALRVTGDGNTFIGYFDGDITLTSISENNTVIGRCTGTVDDVSGNNDVSNVN